jgi:hypothetical protein
LELSVSLALLSILMVAIGSAILLASKALPDASTSAFAAGPAAGIADQIATELLTAVSVTQNSPTMIEFTVERGGASHTIRYKWSATPGDPLTRQYDSGPAVNVLEDVQSFTLTYHTREVTITSSECTTSEEMVLASFEGWAGITPEEENYGLDSAGWTCQFFLAAIPDGATELTITRAMLKMRQGARGTGITFTVGIHESAGPSDPTPQPNPIGTVVTKPGAYLPTSYEWREFVFSDVVIHNPTQNYVVVVKGSSVGNPSFADGDVLRLFAPDGRHDPVPPDNNTCATWTYNEGGRWQPKASLRNQYDHPFYVYGTYTSEETSTRTSDLLELVGIELLAGSAPPIRVQTQVLSRPELSTP